MPEKVFGRDPVQVPAMKKIIYYQLGRESLRTLPIVQAQMCQATSLIAQGAFGPAIDCKTLANLYKAIQNPVLRLEIPDYSKSSSIKSN